VTPIASGLSSTWCFFCLSVSADSFSACALSAAVLTLFWDLCRDGTVFGRHWLETAMSCQRRVGLVLSAASAFSVLGPLSLLALFYAVTNSMQFGVDGRNEVVFALGL